MDKKEIPILIVFLILVALGVFIVAGSNNRREEGRIAAQEFEEQLWTSIRNAESFVLTNSTFRITDDEFLQYYIGKEDVFYQPFITSLEPNEKGGGYHKGPRLLGLEFHALDDHDEHLATLRIIQDDYESNIVLEILSDGKLFSYSLLEDHSDLYEAIMSDIKNHLEEQNVYLERRYPD